jgi:hypothetical protein
MAKNWESYEQVAVDLLNQFASQLGLKYVEGKQQLEGLQSCMQWEIDAKGVKDNGIGFVIIECRRHTTSKIKPEAMGGLAWRIIDTKASGGILVSPLGFQEGAAKVAAASNIIEVTLNETSTNSSYLLRFLNKIMLGFSLPIIIGNGTFSGSLVDVIPSDENDKPNQ